VNQYELKKVKIIPSHVGYFRFLEDCQDVGWIPKQVDIPSPYRYSPSELVYKWKGKNVIIKEVSHKKYVVFEILKGKIYKTDDEAGNVYIASKKELEEAGVDPGFGSTGPWARSSRGPIDSHNMNTARGYGFSFSRKKAKNTFNAKRRLGDERFFDDEEYEKEEDEDEV